MKRNLQLLLLVVLLPFFAQSQFKHDVGLSSSWREFRKRERQINVTAEYAIYWKKFTAGVGIGGECWYHEYPFSNPNRFMQPSYTAKIEPWLGFESSLFHSGVFISAKIGIRFYFLNQLLDSLNLVKSYYYENLQLGDYSRHYVETLPNFDLYGPTKGSVYYVTKMNVFFLPKFSLGYAFERVKISAFVMPYKVRFHYQNAADPDKKGETKLFFYDVGLSVNYRLPLKKKEK